MLNLQSEDKARLRSFAIVSAILFFIVAFTYGVNAYFNHVIDGNWGNISVEKSDQIKEECLNVFNSYQGQTSYFSGELAKNKKLTAALSTQNTRKSYEAISEIEGISSYSLEIYNSRLELFLFEGRQLNPDVTELKRALSGEKFSSVKEIGFYTYIVVYEPITTDSLTAQNKTVSSSWVLVTGRLLDVKYGFQNKFFKDIGITKEISQKFHTDVVFDFTRFNSQGAAIDSSFVKDKLSFELKNIKQEVIGKLYVPQLEKSSYILSVERQFAGAQSVEVFILSLFLLSILVFYIDRLKSLQLKTLLFAVVFIAVRYVWIGVDFPARIVTGAGDEMFDPVYYASGFAYGVGRSIGDILISSAILLSIVLYTARQAVIFFRRNYDKSSLFQDVAYVSISFITGFAAVRGYGLIVQSIIYDSTLKFIDRSQIFTTSQPQLIYANLAILLLSVSLLMILALTGIIITKVLQHHLIKNTFVRRYSVLLVFAVLILLNILLELFGFILGDPVIKLNYRLLIYALCALFTYFVYRQMLVTKNYRIVNLLNISLLLLACVIFVPSLLLSKITSQENRYLERITKDIAEQSDDKINFLISSSLDDAMENPNLVSDLKNKNKYPRLAFNIWAQSKFINEDINSAVFILDTAKKLISDFNTSTSELAADSVINFSIRSLQPAKKETKKDISSLDSLSNGEDNDIDFASETLTSADNDEVLQNKEMKFYCSIRPIEKPGLRYSKFSRYQGYVIIAAQYDAKSFVTQAGGGIFRNFTRDNITNKLTSAPVISEFSDGELVGSSNREVSKAFVKSLDAFRESVKDKPERTALRYDEFESELYKTFYFMPRNQQASSPEKIYAASVKLNDLGLYSFFILRYLLFAVVIFVIVAAVYLVYKVIVYYSFSQRTFSLKFRFREKLFVSFVLASVLPMVVLAFYTRELAKEKNSEYYKSQIISDLRIMEQYIKTKAPNLELPVQRPGKESNKESISDIFGRGFSESDKNFNLFVKARLAATTNEQLYKSDLLDTRISGSAFYNVALLRKDYYQETQEIGDYKFIVGYKPMFDRFNNLAGIISTQTVFNQSEINEQLTESLVYIFGPYILAVILLIAIVNVISYRISNPIVKLQKATEQLSKGNVDIQVKTSSSDEISELITSFNRMTIELKRSRAELKKAERETAWRDIARQIAHEIKNPLTPMKLAMQHLYYAFTHGANDFKSIIQTTNKLIIEQIESLNRIATEFSDFAKMPSRNYEPLNVEEILKDVVTLLNREGKINIELLNKLGESRIIGDKDEVKRAFINIIRNSTQAIDEKNLNRPDGKVNITGIKNNGYYVVKVKDNGVGMDDVTLQQLFEPYFSTKSSGMGLGLVITKKILDDMNARILVTSEVNKGTEVEIRFRVENERLK